MKIMSARSFRMHLPDQPAIIARRGDDGSIEILGKWLPNTDGSITAEAIDQIGEPKTVHVTPLPAPRPFTPAPKPGKR